MGAGVGLWVGGGQPFTALATAVRMSSMAMAPSALASPIGQAERARSPMAMVTSVRRSSTVT
ncbi:hypothetical protein L6Q96_18295 [Candidatus Binatia bacterium]|nr:hypothetical protein [Candidatus Binatia bacterium]